MGGDEEQAECQGGYQNNSKDKPRNVLVTPVEEECHEGTGGDEAGEDEPQGPSEAKPLRPAASKSFVHQRGAPITQGAKEQGDDEVHPPAHVKNQCRDAAV